MITYEESSVLVEGEIQIGNQSVEQIVSSNPPQFFVAANLSVFPMRMGLAITRHPGGNGLIPAIADTIAHAAIGIAAQDIRSGYAGTIQTSGVFVMADWKTLIGQHTLQPMAAYYLDMVAGLLTAVSPSVPGQVSQQIGVSISPVALSIDIKYPILL